MSLPTSSEFCYKHGMRIDVGSVCVLCKAGHGPLRCGVCDNESSDRILGVAAIPGVPMSIAWCVLCLQKRNVVPAFVFEHDFIHVAGGDPSRLVDWARERETWADGRYMSFEEYVKRITPEMVQQQIAEYERKTSEQVYDEEGRDE